MTLRQEVEQLLAEWQGLDAVERSSKRGELVDDLMALMRPRAKSRREGAAQPAAPVAGEPVAA
jgi:hypothetical protein